MERTATLTSADQTADFAKRLAPRLAAGDVILLTGEVGAGKTHFARALIQSLLATPEDVPSPTFTLVQTYDAKDGTEVWHADLYRLTDPTEVEELGLIDAMQSAICLIEWPDRLGSLRPNAALDITLETNGPEDHRALTARWSDMRWTDKMNDWTP